MPVENDKYQEVIIVVTVSIILFWLLIGSIIYFVIQYQRRRLRDAKEKAELQIAYEKELLQSKIEIQEQAFSSISRELHDHIGHDLSLAKLNLNSIKSVMLVDDNERIGITKELISSSIEQIRSISKTLLGEKISRIGLVEAVKNEINRITKLGILKMELVCPNSDFSIENQKEIILFRIVQEAINNILKHSEATSATVTLDYAENILKILIQDNGKGFKLVGESGAGIGLLNMKNRAQAIGANLNIGSATGNGTLVEIVLYTANK